MDCIISGHQDNDVKLLIHCDPLFPHPIPINSADYLAGMACKEVIFQIHVFSKTTFAARADTRPRKLTRM